MSYNVKDVHELLKTELVKFAGQLGIPRRHKMTKSQLIDAICEFAKEGVEVPDIKEEKSNTGYEVIGFDIGSGESVSVTTTKEEFERLQSLIPNGELVTKDDHVLGYVRKARVGTIVAFRRDDGFLDSAAIIDKNEQEQMVMVETKYGKVYELSFFDIVWVKTGSRWPRKFFEEFKRQKHDKTRV